MAVKKYNVNWVLNHDGKEFAAGETVSLEEKIAAPLVAAGVISLPSNAEDRESAGE